MPHPHQAPRYIHVEVDQVALRVPNARTAKRLLCGEICSFHCFSGPYRCSGGGILPRTGDGNLSCLSSRIAVVEV